MALAAARAQHATPPLAFEVVSIKRSDPRSQQPPIELLAGGGFRANTSLGFLFQIAYRVKPFQIVCAPAWVDSASYTIDARTPEGTTSPERGKATAQTMERCLTLMAERSSVAKNGPKLKEGTGEFRLRLGRGAIHNEGGAKIAMLVSLLSNNLGKIVVDKTGLTGSYSFHLQWTPDPPPSANTAELVGPTLFTALEEQLGLKLEVQKAPVETIVIERIERPSEN